MIPLRSLHFRLALTVMILFIPVALGMGALAHHLSEIYQQEATQRLYANLVAHIGSETPLIRNGRADARALDKLFHMIWVINPAIDIYLVDPLGRVLAHSAPAGKLKRTRIDLTPVRNFLSGRHDFPVLGDDPRVLAGRKLFSVAPITHAHKLQGYLYLILASETSTTIFQGLRNRYAWQAGVWTISLGLPVALAAGFMTLFGLTRRLRRLTSDVARFRQQGEGEIDVSDKVTPGDEITQLQGCFQQMTARIESQMEALRQRDDQRRERVTTLSHDLRTSLTVLHGYLETLQLKTSSLSEAERARFIDTAAKHSKRLARMVNDVFELAKLEYQDPSPSRERFALCELARDIVHQFQPVAYARGIELSCESGPGSCWVEADIGMLGRVLTNLVDNALKFTPAGRSVSVRLMSDGTRVRVVVEDTGNGMNAETLFNLAKESTLRPSSHSSRPDSSGLGLVTVKRILSLHGAHLTIESAVGRGSTFGFSLPLMATGSVRIPVMKI
jgi:signal transduction histidine kinase